MENAGLSGKRSKVNSFRITLNCCITFLSCTKTPSKKQFKRSNQNLPCQWRDTSIAFGTFLAMRGVFQLGSNRPHERTETADSAQQGTVHQTENIHNKKGH